MKDNLKTACSEVVIVSVAYFVDSRLIKGP